MQGPDNASPSVIDSTARRPVCSINIGAITVSPDRLRTLQEPFSSDGAVLTTS